MHELFSPEILQDGAVKGLSMIERGHLMAERPMGFNWAQLEISPNTCEVKKNAYLI